MDVLTEGSKAGHHPLGPGLGVHRDGRSGRLAKGSKPAPEVVSSVCNFLIGEPVVVAEGELLEELSVLLDLIFLSQNFASSEAAFGLVLVDGVVERLGHGVHLSADDDLLVDRAVAFVAAKRHGLF